MNASPLRIGIAGAGAIGCTLAARLAGRGHTVNVLARGETLSAIHRDGIHLSDLDGDHHVRIHASDDAASLGEQDLIFLCTKAPALASLLPQIQPMIGAETVVIPVVNGVPWWYFHGEGGRYDGQRVNAVDPQSILGEALDLRHVIGCVVFITAHCTANAVVESHTPHLMIFGELDNRLSPRLERVRALIESAGIEARATERIRDNLWTKIIANITSNPLSVITGATLDQLYSLPELQELVRTCLHETLLTAAAHGARVSIDPQTFLELGASMGAVRTSMLQDYEKGRPLELAAIGDAVLELADYMAIPMPVTRHLIALARFRGDQACH
ncbi:ketopantoate reductase family protein [Pseudomonas mucidolens]|uniref:2-dehydropantoate 2-reductase n=1 Tax=Pseudomonas mucidolens TaxID=46679 RepID=A0A1H2M862_9PSED|nr:2-dehydropantoate 2-reductase [Pseudomonas mucidolens]SDU89440.1 ketopantoate reductase [Pseudomonas mucidolens]SQH34358.1 2-dehydropantoate 2-reductase [Pseudomonas mucidolens]